MRCLYVKVTTFYDRATVFYFHVYRLSKVATTNFDIHVAIFFIDTKNPSTARFRVARLRVIKRLYLVLVHLYRGTFRSPVNEIDYAARI